MKPTCPECRAPWVIGPTCTACGWKLTRSYVGDLILALMAEQDALEPPPYDIPPGDSLEFRRHAELGGLMDRLEEIAETLTE